TGIAAAGVNGTNGDSAYDIAKKNGFVGTEEEWLASLKGEQGQQGIQGIQGEKGDKGEKGETGATGATGAQGEQGVGVSKVEIINNELTITLSDGNKFNLGNIKGEKGEKGDTGAQGEKGDKGDTGVQGVQGEQGVSVTNVTLTADGDLSMTFSSGETISLGNIKGADGQDGVGIDEVYIQDGNLYVKKTTDTNAVNLGSVKGEKGDKGDQGEQGPKGDTGAQGPAGADGRGIVKTEIIDGHLWITYTDDLENPVDVGKINDAYDSTPGYEGTVGLAFYPLADGTYGVAQGTATELTEIVIPGTYYGKPVTKILENGFDTLSTITLPATITSVGMDGISVSSKIYFEGTISEWMNIDFVHNPQFSGASLGSCDLYIQGKLLTNLTIPEDVVNIKEMSFAGIKSLTSVTIPSHVNTIGLYAFNTSGLTSATFETTTGWKLSNSNTVASSLLANTSSAATALRYRKVTSSDKQYSNYVWSHS
ncbi:MAG: collagen-like protein, partial [Clostridia bacterium]|nr:collagen-like protein [Clostridia bacterium]